MRISYSKKIPTTNIVDDVIVIDKLERTYKYLGPKDNIYCQRDVHYNVLLLDI